MEITLYMFHILKNSTMVVMMEKLSSIGMERLQKRWKIQSSMFIAETQMGNSFFNQISPIVIIVITIGRIRIQNAFKCMGLDHAVWQPYRRDKLIICALVKTTSKKLQKLMLFIAVFFSKRTSSIKI